MLKERLNTYRQHIQQPKLQQTDVKSHITKYGTRNFKIMPFFVIQEDNKILTKSHETYLLKKLNLRLIKDTIK